MENVGHFDVMLGDGKFTVVKDPDEADDPAMPRELFSVRFFRLAPISSIGELTATLNINIQSKMACKKKSATTNGCDSSSHGILNSGSPKRTTQSIAIHLRKSQKDSAFSSTTPAQS